jgi:hypothetical protein
LTSSRTSNSSRATWSAVQAEVSPGHDGVGVCLGCYQDLPTRHDCFSHHCCVCPCLPVCRAGATFDSACGAPTDNGAQTRIACSFGDLPAGTEVKITLSFTPTLPAEAPVLGSLVFAARDADTVANNNFAETWINPVSLSDGGTCVPPSCRSPVGSEGGCASTEGWGDFPAAT